MKNVAGERGFTLIEVIVVAGIIAILAGILVPMILKEIDEARITRATADIRSISTALIVLKKDTGQWPVNASCSPAVTLLYGNGGVMPTIAGVGWNAGTPNFYENYLSIDDNGCWPQMWKGPYMPMITADPWGRKYITNAGDFMTPNAHVWIISAGPDGIIQTNVTDDIPAGDDIAVRLQ